MRTFYIVALLAWIVLGTLWSKSTFCGKAKATKPSATVSSGAAATATADGDCSRALVFSDGGFEASSGDNFMFGTNGARIKNLTPEFKAVLTEVAEFLSENNDKTLLIEGVYFEKETNSSSKDNLGLARSAAIKGYLVNEFDMDASQLLEGSQVSTNLKCYYNKSSNTISKGAVATFGVK